MPFLNAFLLRDERIKVVGALLPVYRTVGREFVPRYAMWTATYYTDHPMTLYGGYLQEDFSNKYPQFLADLYQRLGLRTQRHSAEDTSYYTFDFGSETFNRGTIDQQIRRLYTPDHLNWSDWGPFLASGQAFWLDTTGAQPRLGGLEGWEASDLGRLRGNSLEQERVKLAPDPESKYYWEVHGL